MVDISEKFKRSSVLKKTELNYSISRDPKFTGTGQQLAMTSKVGIKVGKLNFMNNIISNHSTLPFSNRVRTRYNTVEANLPLELVSKPSLDKSVQDIPMDFSISLRNFNMLPLVREEPLRSSGVNEEEIEDELSFERLSLVREKKEEEEKEKKGEGKKSKSLAECKVEDVKFEVDEGVSVVETFDDRVQSNGEKSRNRNKEEEDEDEEKTRRRIRMLKLPRVDTQGYGFFEALNKFMQIPSVQVDVNLWHKTLFDRCCCLKKKQKLSQEFQEMCEKVIIFAYTGFNTQNSFHAELILSLKKKLLHLSHQENDWISMGFSNNNPYEKDLKHNIAPFGLILILFLLEFIPITLESMIEYCLANEFAFIPLAFDVVEIAILAMRKNKLTEIMMLTQKCLETLCFFHAGCLAQWFVLHRESKKNFLVLSQTLEQQAMKYPSDFVELTKSLIKFQSL